jgi:hypothetical protein
MTLFAGGILGALTAVSVGGFLAGGAASASTTAVVRVAGTGATALEDPSGGSIAACTAYAYSAIRARVRVTGVPADCRRLSPGQVSFAASTAIRMASGSGTKSAVRRRAGQAAPWVSALLGPAPVGPEGSPAGSAAGSAGTTAGAGSRIGFSETVAQFGGLFAWLAAAASGGWIVLRWWLAGGGLGGRRGLRRMLHGSASAAPPAVTVAHVGLGLFGLVLWAIFMITGSAPLAWACVCLVGPIAGLGMTVLLLGLPSPQVRTHGADSAAALSGHMLLSDNTVLSGNGVLAAADARAGTALRQAPAGPLPSARRRPGGMPVVAIAAHGVFITVAIMFVILAAIGAG